MNIGGQGPRKMKTLLLCACLLFAAVVRAHPEGAWKWGSDSSKTSEEAAAPATTTSAESSGAGFRFQAQSTGTPTLIEGPHDSVIVEPAPSQSNAPLAGNPLCVVANNILRLAIDFFPTLSSRRNSSSSPRRNRKRRSGRCFG